MSSLISNMVAPITRNNPMDAQAPVVTSTNNLALTFGRASARLARPAAPYHRGSARRTTASTRLREALSHVSSITDAAQSMPASVRTSVRRPPIQTSFAHRGSARYTTAAASHDFPLSPTLPTFLRTANLSMVTFSGGPGANRISSHARSLSDARQRTALRGFDSQANAMTVGLDSARPLAYAYAVPSPILQASSDTVASHHFVAANTDSFRSASPILVHPPVFQDPVPAFDRTPVYQNDSLRAAHRPVYQDLDVTADPLPVNRASLLAVFSAQVPCMDVLLQFASVIREQQERHDVLNERSVAQDDKQHQLRIYTVELDNELNDRLKHVDLHLDLTHDWYHRQLRWFCGHSGSRTIAAQVIEACHRAARSTMQAERQLGEVESLIDKIRATRLSFVLSEPQYFIDPLGDSIKMVPGYDVCRQFGNRHCPYAYPSEYHDHYDWDQESCISEDAVNLERHHIITFDRKTGSDHLDAVVHLGPVKEFQPTNHAAATMIKYMQELREVRDTGNYSLQRRSSSSSSSSYSFWASSRTLVPAPFPPLPASVELRPLVSQMTHIQARRRAARMTPKVSRRLLGS